MTFFESVEKIPSWIDTLTSRNDDDTYDRMSHRWTVAQLAIFAIVVSVEQIWGEQISCWVPAHFSGAWEEYTKSYCWTRNTYYLDMNDDIPRMPADFRGDGGPERGEHEITYYQWVPLLLMIQALTFFLPCMLWRSLNSKTGIDVNMIVETSETVEKELEDSERRKRLYYLTNLMDRFLGYSRAPAKKGFCRDCSLSFKQILGSVCCCCGRRFGNYISVLYLFIKFLFLANAFCQFFILDKFLGQTDYHFYGITVVQAMIKGEDWTASKRFPRVAMCDLVVRRLGNNHRYTVQCALIMNMFNEKIYFYIWWWLFFLCIATAVGLIITIVHTIFSSNRYRYIKQYALCTDPTIDYSKNTSQCFSKFVNHYLRADGHLVLRLIDLNTNKITLRDLIGALWDNYKSKPNIMAQFDLKPEEDGTNVFEDGHEKVPL